MVGNREFNHGSRMLDAAGHGVVTGRAVFDTDARLVLTHRRSRSRGRGG